MRPPCFARGKKLLTTTTPSQIFADLGLGLVVGEKQTPLLGWRKAAATPFLHKRSLTTLPCSIVPPPLPHLPIRGATRNLHVGAVPRELHLGRVRVGAYSHSNASPPQTACKI